MHCQAIIAGLALLMISAAAQAQPIRSRVLEGHTGSVMSVAFSPDGKTLASAARDDTVRLWGVETGKPLRTLTDHHGDVFAVAFSPDGKILASASGDKTIRLLDLATGKSRTLQGHTDMVRSLSFSPDGQTLASGSVDKTVRLWDARTGELRRTLTGHEHQVRSVAFSPGGMRLASGGPDKTVRLWHAHTGKALATLTGHKGSIEAVAWSPDSSTLASSSEDSTVQLWDTDTGQVRRVLEGHAGEIDSLAFSPRGQILASGSKDKTIRLWDPRTGVLLQTLTGHKTRVESLAFSPDGKTLASGSGGPEATIRLWDISKVIDMIAPRAERGAAPPYQVGRSVVLAPHGMVATSHPLAAQIGLDVLKKGGNAVDAAIAANAALGLMEPMMCGIGGDLHVLVWHAKTGKLHALNASGRSPYRATRELLQDKGLKEIPERGPLSWSVPGCVDGWEELSKRFGTMKLAELLQPSIRYAEHGFPVPERIADYWLEAEEKWAKYPDTAKTFLIDGRAPGGGDLVKNPFLARTYREIAAGGRDAFYRGRIAKEIVAFSDKTGGLFTLKDFEDHNSTWVDAASTTYRGHEVWQLPPPTQGISVLQMLNLLEGYDLQKLGAESPDWWHLFLEAKKVVYADRARYYADPVFAKVPVAELISKPYAAERRKLIDLKKARLQVDAGDPRLGKGDTVYLCVVDKDRNCVSLIQSIYLVFGSGLVPGDLGFALQNRGALFALDPKHPNSLEPHKRPFHTIIPSLVMKDGRPWLVFGVMGGDMQTQGQVQILCNLIDFGMNIQQAGEAPRLEHQGSATPTGKPAKADGGTVLPERGISAKILDELRRRGHILGDAKTAAAGFQGILIDPRTGLLHGGSDPRKDGCALGY